MRIQPGEGVIGRAFVSARPLIVQADEANKRLRYRTNSYMLRAARGVRAVPGRHCPDRSSRRAGLRIPRPRVGTFAGGAGSAGAGARSRSREPRRADQGGDGRPGDRALQPAVFRGADAGRSAARSTPAAGPRPSDGRHRRLQAHQRHARASRRRPRAARRRQPACAAACGSSICAPAMVARSSRS